MSRADAPTWLGALQARFSEVLRTPLDPGGGVLRADTSRYAPETLGDILPGSRLGAAERLAIYHRQYWLRLLRTMQEQYPLTTRLLGAWHFNQRAIDFLQARPPRSRDLGDVVEGFDAFLVEALEADDGRRRSGEPSVPHLALAEAVRLDAAFRQVFIAPEQPVFELSAVSEDELLGRSLVLSSALRVVQEHWPLARLRTAVLNDPGERPVALPAPWRVPHHWAVYRAPRGVVHHALDPLQARLLELLGRERVGHALALLEVECTPEDRARLPALAQQLFAGGMRLGFFSGLGEAGDATP